MPIKFSFKKLPVDSEGNAYASLEEFQAAMLVTLIKGEGRLPDNMPDFCKYVVSNKAEVMEILELTMDARPTARGQKRPRKAKVAPEETPALTGV